MISPSFDSPLAVGISPCPNDVFIFSGWILGRTNAPPAHFDFADVQTLNERARQGVYGLVKVSYANVPACEGYTPLECGGALGRGCGPLLLTGGDAWDPKADVLVPGEQTTANFLLDFWNEREGNGPLRKRFMPFDELYRELKANPERQGVVIHEMRFTYEADGLRCVQDLGAAWEHVTGAPIPLGALIRKTVSRTPSLTELESAVRESLDWAWEHQEEALELCGHYAQDMTPSVMRSHIDLYVNAFSRDLGEEGRRAVSLLQDGIRNRRT